MRAIYARAALLAAALHSAALPPAAAQDSFLHELRYAVEPGAKKPGEEELKQIAAVLERRLSIFATRGGRVEVKSADDIRLRAAADRIAPVQTRMAGIPGVLEFRSLESVRSNLNPRGRYLIDVLSVNGVAVTRFRDGKSGTLAPASEVLEKCPLLCGSGDLVANGASVVRDGVLLAVRVTLNAKAARRLERFLQKPGRMLAGVLDGEIVSINAVARRPLKARAPDGTEGDEVGQIDLGGGFANGDEAAYLAAVINSGPLPARLRFVDSRIVTE